MSNLLLVTVLLMISWQLVKISKENRERQKQLFFVKQKLQCCLEEIETQSPTQAENQMAYHHCAALGQSIAALHIQLQVAHKLWQINPFQAKHALSEAYELSSTLMQDIRQTVKTLKQTSPSQSSQTIFDITQSYKQ